LVGGLAVADIVYIGSGTNIGAQTYITNQHMYKYKQGIVIIPRIMKLYTNDINIQNLNKCLILPIKEKTTIQFSNG